MVKANGVEKLREKTSNGIVDYKTALETSEEKKDKVVGGLKEKKIIYITPANIKHLNLGEIIRSNPHEIIVEYENFDDYDKWNILANLIIRLLTNFLINNVEVSLTLKGAELPKSIYYKITNRNFGNVKINFEVTEPNELLNIETDDYIVEDGILTWVNPKVKKLVLPEGVLKLYESFKRCKELESIVIPGTVKKIHSSAFEYCYSLKNVTMADGVKVIDSNAFGSCMSLESITIPKTVRIINYKAFEFCWLLKNVRLLDGLTDIKSKAFYECKNLKEIILPSSTKKLGENIFEECPRLKNVTIRYKSFEELINLINNNPFFFATENVYHRDLYSICNLKLFFFKIKKSVNLVFEGPELTDEQKEEIIKKNIDDKAKLFFKVNDNIEQIEKEDIEREKVNAKEKYICMYDSDKDIEVLLSKISNLCNYLSDEVKNNILSIVEKLLDNYKNDLNNLRPEFGKNNNSPFEFNGYKDVKMLKPMLLTDLESIILNLSSADNLIQFLEELNNYKKLLDTDINDLSESNSVEDNIKNIIYLSKYLDNKGLDKLSMYINDTISKVSLNITKMYDDGNPILLNYIDYKQEFIINVSNLYNEVCSEFNRVGKYKMILDSLSSKECEFSDGNDIWDLINSTRYIISELSNGNYKRKFEEEFSKIRQKYMEIVSNIISDEKSLENTDYVEFEKSIKKDLTPLLEDINKYAYLDEYEKYKGNKTNILSQLHLSKDIVEACEIVNLDEETSLQPITSCVIEINNKILSNKKMTSNDKNKIKNELKTKIVNALSLVENKEIDSLNKYNEILAIIIRSLIDVDCDINDFISKLEEYTKYYK